MQEPLERNLGEQPLARIMADRGLKARDLVAGSSQQITYKMVSRACKGRRLTPQVQRKILDALNAATGGEYSLGQLFTYGARSQRPCADEPSVQARPDVGAPGGLGESVDGLRTE